jgi:ribonuclease T
VSEDLYDDELESSPSGPRHPMAARFRGYLPVVVDVETGGFNCATDALLEIAATTIAMDEQGFLYPDHTHFFRVEPFAGANIEQAALDFTGIKLDHPLRMAVSEEHALTEIFRGLRKSLKANSCKRAILVGHNSSFDLGFLNAAVARTGIKRNPFHPFSSFDTATLAGLAYGQTVLAKACQAADIDFDGKEAHSARYDTEKTAELFCGIVNRWKEMGGGMDFDDEVGAGQPERKQ